MEKTVVVMQPGYLPWLGFFELLWQSDVFVVYDNVQYDKNGWRNRNRIKTANGPMWLTVPVSLPNGLSTKIYEARIDNSQRWQKKHIASIEQNYRKARYFSDYFPPIKELLEQKWESLLELNLKLITRLANLLGIQREIHLASELEIQDDDKIKRLVKITSLFGGTRFYEPAGGKAYFNESSIQKFKDAGIGVEFQNYRHPIYAQLYGNFIPNLSVVDLILNHGPQSLKIITSTSTRRRK